jgi:hypothetical protein
MNDVEDETPTEEGETWFVLLVPVLLVDVCTIVDTEDLTGDCGVVEDIEDIAGGVETGAGVWVETGDLGACSFEDLAVFVPLSTVGA